MCSENPFRQGKRFPVFLSWFYNNLTQSLYHSLFIFTWRLKDHLNRSGENLAYTHI